MSIILETEEDRIIEERAIKRIVAARGHCQSFRFNEFSLVDYLISGPETEAEAIAFVEVKGRKETAEKVRNYGGLMLKARKIPELITIEEYTKTPTFVAFPFESGFGDIYYAKPKDLLHKKAFPPPPRRNYRGLDCDDEPVVYLNWDTEVFLLVPKEQK